jgi:anti-sigma regulatory factor (Ser/Thr protein kinase)
VEGFAADLDPRELEDARLLTSELVTNAVVHGRGGIELIALLDDARLTIEVTDHGEGFERTIHRGDLNPLGGNGLNIVDALASRWGIDDGSSHVWVELARRHGSKPTPSPRGDPPLAGDDAPAV